MHWLCPQLNLLLWTEVRPPPPLLAMPRTADSHHLSGGRYCFHKCLVKDEVCLTHLWPFLANWWCGRLLKALRIIHLLIVWAVVTLWASFESPVIPASSWPTKGLLVASGRKYCDYSEIEQLICSPLCPPPLMTPRSWAGTGGLFWVLPVLLPITALTSLLCHALFFPGERKLWF